MAKAGMAAKADDMHRTWADAFNAGDLEAVVALYEPGAVLVPAPGHVARGTDEIRAAFEQFLAAKPRITFGVESVITSGDLALGSCEWKLTGVMPDGEAVEMAGIASELLRRQADGRWETLTKGSRSLREGEALVFPEGLKARADKGSEGAVFLEFGPGLDDSYLERNGHVPLPPYIRRADGCADSERYQTIYAKETGSSAAPTAGLHFTGELLGKLEKKGIEIRFVTLHVGLGTFMPVRSENVEEHRMHTEEFLVPEDTADSVEKARKEGRPVLAVGTTSLRSLESAWIEAEGRLRRGRSSTDIFITPGYRFKAVDRLFTNFHTPESTLLMLVSAFAGKELIDRAYREAVEKRYRFFSYGDAMLIQ